MESDVILKILIGAFVALAFGINGKMVWDWLTNRNRRVEEKLEEISTKLNKLSEVVTGNGKVETSIVFRIAAIEDFMKEMKKIKEARGL